MKLINLLIERENLQTQLNNLKSQNKFDSQTIANRIPIIKRLFSIDGLIAKFSKIERYEAQEKLEEMKRIKGRVLKVEDVEPKEILDLAFFLMLVEMIFQHKDFNTKYFIALSLNQLLGDNYENRKRY
ncbi:hypothetical protein [Achromobacter xylosoxidans]|uniref:hypothetical protein n=1 Tax=Alcaligenes xylosoxydans xylosoxydans TaxID=85698 RepID=UPI000A66940E|nr:hypothetical protein [Achromobacter xylosoxidans]